MDFRDHWDLDTAMQVLQNKTVDSKLWAEAVEWLLLHGPAEIVDLLLKASSHATGSTFPELQVKSYTHDGQPCYDVKEIARSLGISEKEAVEIIARKEQFHKAKHFFDDGSIGTVQ